MVVYLDSPFLLAADQLEVLAQVRAVAQETHLDDLDGEGLALAGSASCVVGGVHGARGAAGSPAPPGRGAGVPGHRAKTQLCERHPEHACLFFFFFF